MPIYVCMHKCQKASTGVSCLFNPLMLAKYFGTKQLFEPIFYHFHWSGIWMKSKENMFAYIVWKWRQFCSGLDDLKDKPDPVHHGKNATGNEKHLKCRITCAHWATWATLSHTLKSESCHDANFFSAVSYMKRTFRQNCATTDDDYLEISSKYHQIICLWILFFDISWTPITMESTFHWGGNVVILTKVSSLVLKTSGTTSDEIFVKMAFLFQYSNCCLASMKTNSSRCSKLYGHRPNYMFGIPDMDQSPMVDGLRQMFFITVNPWERANLTSLKHRMSYSQEPFFVTFRYHISYVYAFMIFTDTRQG